MKRLFVFLFWLSTMASGQILDNYGGWTLVHDSTGPVNKQNATCSQSTFTKTCSVVNSAVFAPKEPICVGGTSTAMDYVYDGTDVNAGADKITTIVGNTLTLTAHVSHTAPSTAGFIEPCRFYFVTRTGAPGPIGNGPKFMTPFYNDMLWSIEMGGADYSTATIPTALLTARYSGTACNAATDDVDTIFTFGFNTIGMDSFELYPTGGFGAPCPGLHKAPMSVEAFSTGYCGTNVFGYAQQPCKNMDEAILNGSYAANCPVRRGQFDPFDPNFVTHSNAFMSTDTSIVAYLTSPFFSGLKTDDVGIDGETFSGSTWMFPTLPRGHNDCDAALLVAITSPWQSVSNHSCCYGNPAPPFLYGFRITVDAKTWSNTSPNCADAAHPCTLPDYAQYTYGTVGAMNTAFGSNYTTFGTTGVTHTAEVLGSGNGSTLTFSGTILHTPISPFSVAVLVGATPVAGSLPSYARGTGSANILIGKNATGTINFSTGVWSLTFTAGNAPVSGTNNITATYVSGGWPVSVNGGTGFEDEDGTNSWVPTQPICVGARPLTWSTGQAIPPNSLLSVTGSWQYTILGGTTGGTQPTWSSTIGTTVTDGSGLTQITWKSEGPGVCATSGGDFSPAMNGSAAYGAFIEGFIQHLGGQYGKVYRTAIETFAPDSLYGFTDGLGDYWTPPRDGVLQAVQAWADFGEPDGALEPTKNPLSTEEMAREVSFTNKPLLSYTNFYSSNASLPTPAGVGYPVLANQPARGAYWGTEISWMLNWSNPSVALSPGQNPFVGIMQWFMGDTQGNNGGIKTTGAGCANSGKCYNFYKVEDVSTNVNCLPPHNALSCGGESGGANFLGQDAITAITAANFQWDTSVVPKYTTWGKAAGPGFFSINFGPTNVGQENAYCGAGDVPVFGSPDGPATEPQACIYTDITGSLSLGTVHHLVTSTDVVNCFAGNSSCPGGVPVCGDVLSLLANTSFSGIFTLGTWASCNATHWLTIETSGVASLPAPGHRVNPSYAGVSSLPGRPTYSGGSSNVMAQIITPNTSAAITLSANNQYIRFIGIEITRAASTGAVTILFDPTNVEVEAGVNHIILDRGWYHGTPTDETRRFTNMDRTSYFAIINSWTGDFHCVSISGSCTDSQVSTGGSNGNSGDTDKAWKHYNNFMESGGESIEMGGGAGVITPTDIEIRENHFFKPQTWNPDDPSYNGGVSGNAFVVKNHVECKNCSRVLIEGNYLENVWGGFSQSGAAMLLTPKTQSPGNQCPLCTTNNVTIRYNWIKTANEYMEMANAQNDDGFFANGGYNYSDHDNVAENLAPINCNEENNAISSGLNVYSGNLAPVVDYAHDIVRNHLTLVFAAVPCAAVNGWPSAMVNFDGPIGPVQNNINWTNIIDSAGHFGVGGILSGTNRCAFGNQTTFLLQFVSCYSSSAFNNNGIIGGIHTPAWTWPGTGHQFPTTYSNAGFVNYNNGVGGDYRVCSSALVPSPSCAGASSFHAAGTDGKDMGAAIPLVLNYTNQAQ